MTSAEPEYDCIKETEYIDEDYEHLGRPVPTMPLDIYEPLKTNIRIINDGNITSHQICVWTTRGKITVAVIIILLTIILVLLALFNKT